MLTLLANGTCAQIDFSGATPAFNNVGSVGQTRYWSNMVILADGKVMISGGSGVRNKLTRVTNQVAIWDPETHAVTSTTSRPSRGSTIRRRCCCPTRASCRSAAARRGR